MANQSVFVDLFFPLAFFLLALSLAGVVVAFFALDDEAQLILWIRRILGSWLAAFSLILVGLFVVQARAIPAEEFWVAPNQSGSTDGLALSTVIRVLALSGWTVGFGALTLAGAYFFLALWSTAVRVDAGGITRQLALGQDVIPRATIDRIVEIVYFCWFNRDDRQLRTRSFFVVIPRCRLSRCYALYRPTSVTDEDEFRASVGEMAPLVVVTLPGFPPGAPSSEPSTDNET